MNYSNTLETIYKTAEKLGDVSINCIVSVDQQDPYVLHIDMKNEKEESIEYDTKSKNIVIKKQEKNNEFIKNFLQIIIDDYPDEYFFIMETEGFQIDNIDILNTKKEKFINGIYISRKENPLFEKLNNAFATCNNRFVYSYVKKYKYENYYRFCIITIWGIYKFEVHPCHLKQTYIVKRRKQDDILLTMDEIENWVENLIMKTFQKVRLESVFDDEKHPFYHLIDDHVGTRVAISKKQQKETLGKLKLAFTQKELFHLCFQFMTTKKNQIVSTSNSFIIPFPNHIVVGIYNVLYTFQEEKEAFDFYHLEKENAPQIYAIKIRKKY